MKLYRKLIARFKLLKMQRATGIKLTKKQRKVALNPSYPNICGWDRQSGKTVADIKKVIKGLEHCADRRFCNDACPYSDIIRDQNRGIDECVSALAKDALELMKEKLPKSPTWRRGKAFCGGCGGCLENKEQHSSDIVSSIRFCKWCGTPVDWSND